MESKANEENRWCVYMHENRINGKKYIGITSQKPTRRWANGRHYEQCTAFFRAIQKYGWDGFRHEILFTDLAQEEAERLEVELIAKYRTRDPEHGYNLAVGGGAVCVSLTAETKQKMSDAHRGELNAMYGRRHTEEARDKMSRAQTGKYAGERNPFFGQHHTEEARAKMSEANKGRPSPWKGKHPTEETRAKMRDAKAGKHVGEKNPSARAVECLETGGTYKTATEAAASVCADLSSIIKACRGKLKTAGGYHWQYVDGAVSVND